MSVCPVPVKTDVGQIDLGPRLCGGTSKKNDRPTFWRLFSIIKNCCFVIFTDLNFINNDFNVCTNIGFHWSTLSLITRVNQEIFRIYTYLYLFSDLIKWQFALSNNVEIEVDLFTVFAFPSSIMDLWYPLVLKSTDLQQFNQKC